jgi:hypothetical protein
MVSAGYKPCIGSISVGNPNDLNDLGYFVPALRQAYAAGGVWSYHAYTLNYTTDVPSELPFSLRYRQFYNYFAANYPDLVMMPLVLTEGGVDLSGDANTSGWQARGPTDWYQRWLNWFDYQMQQDSYVIGCTLFQNGAAPSWASFDLETPMPGNTNHIMPIIGWLSNYLANPTTAPSAPTGLTASAATKIVLSWTNVVSNPTTYNVKRSSVSGGPYTLIARNVTEGVSATTFTDTSVTNGITYYYVVSAMNAIGESVNSAEVSATASLPNINCGGSAVGSFLGDLYYSGGLTSSTGNTIDLSGVTNPAPMAIYQTQRYQSLTYSIPNLQTNVSYKLRLHFAEFYWSSAGQRVFNVLVNGAAVLKNFDIVAAAGATGKAVIREVNAIPDSTGRISIQLVTLVDNAAINGIEIVTNATDTIPSTPSGLTAAVGSGNVALNWTGPLGATSYKVKRSTVSGTGYTVIASNLTATAFTDVSFNANTTYYYVVSAV